MRKLFFGPAILIAALLFAGCGTLQNISEITDSANSIMNQANDLLKLVDSKVESGELSREAGAFLDERISKLLEELGGTIDQTGGRLFDSANGTINLTFANISALLAQIKTGILDDSVPALLDSLSSQLLLQVNNLSGNLEDIISLSFGNAFVLVDKATNSAVIIGGIVLLAIGVLVFAIILLVRRDKMNAGTVVGLVLAGIYILFFALLVFVTPLRGFIIAGFDFGKKVDALAQTPKITGVVPENFVIGKNERIILYGNNLNRLAKYTVGLYKSDSLSLQFPKDNVIEATRYRIILGDFGKKLGWKMPAYGNFRKQVIGDSASEAEAAEYADFGKQVEKTLFAPRTLALRRTAPRSRMASVDFRGVAQSTFRLVDSAVAMKKMSDYFLGLFKLPEGDFGIRVYQETNRIESPQFISIKNPPPPAPKPDVTIGGVTWQGGQAAKDRDASLRIRLNFSHPESLSNSFTVKVTLNPADIAPFDVNLMPGDIAMARQNNFVDVVSRTFRLKNKGNYQVALRADIYNNVAEENEGNNDYTATLSAGQYVYDATVMVQNFQSLANLDDFGDEYRMHVSVSVAGFATWSFNYNKDGERNNTYGVNQQRTYSGLLPGTAILISTSGYEEDLGFWPDEHDGMGSTPPYRVDIHDKAEKIPFVLSGDKYRFTGYIDVKQRMN